MATCPTCNSTITDDNPGLLAEKIDDALRSSWENAESDNNWGWPVGKTVHVDGVGAAEVVAKGMSDPNGEWRIGHEYSGSEYDPWVVLKIGDNYFKKTGHGDSYGEVSWTGPVRVVKPETKTVTVYEFK